MNRESRIISLTDPNQRRQIIFRPDSSRIVGRRVTEWTDAAGTYGQGGPGFVGFKLEDTGRQPEEWLILCLWAADNWLTVNGQWLGAHPNQYNQQRPLTSNIDGMYWDDFKRMVLGQYIRAFDVEEKRCSLMIDRHLVSVDEDPSTRPVFPGSGVPRILASTDNLRDAWIIAPWPWIEI